MLSLDIKVDMILLRVATERLKKFFKKQRQGIAGVAAEKHVENILKRFDQKVDQDGSAWKPRKDSKPHELLNLSGKLRRSVRATKTAAGAKVKVGSKRVNYAAVHEFGSKKKNISARPYFLMGGNDFVSIGKALVNAVAEVWEERG